jgi:uncharacterized protein YaaN involved in tellurite resistance
MSTDEPRASASQPLKLQLDATTAPEVALPAAGEGTDPELEQRAREYVDVLLAVDPNNADSVQAGRAAIEKMGRDLQRQAASRSEMLQQPVREMSREAADGGAVANALVDLRIQVEALDPGDVDLEAGWFTRMLGRLPGIGTPLQRYFAKYESSQTQIDAIINSLDKGRKQLGRDNVTLAEDQRAMVDLTVKLERQVELARVMDEQLQHRLDGEVAADGPKRRFVQEELLFPLRQRTLDLQQQLAVNQQGVLAIELIIRNNRELIRGVDRAIDVTISALQVAVTVALALAHQKIVLDKISMVNKTTSDLIAGTAERLRTQGGEIHTQAAGTMLEIESLKAAFADINAAMEEISRYRRDALPQMAASIDDLAALGAVGHEALQRLEQTPVEAASPLLELEAG